MLILILNKIEGIVFIKSELYVKVGKAIFILFKEEMLKFMKKVVINLVKVK